MLDLSLISRLAATSPAGAARGPHGPGAAPTDEAAAAFGEALASLAELGEGVDAEALDAAAGETSLVDDLLNLNTDVAADDIDENDEIDDAAAALFAASTQTSVQADPNSAWTLALSSGTAVTETNVVDGASEAGNTSAGLTGAVNPGSPAAAGEPAAAAVPAPQSQTGLGVAASPQAMPDATALESRGKSAPQTATNEQTGPAGKADTDTFTTTTDAASTTTPGSNAERLPAETGAQNVTLDSLAPARAEQTTSHSTPARVVRMLDRLRAAVTAAAEADATAKSPGGTAQLARVEAAIAQLNADIPLATLQTSFATGQGATTSPALPSIEALAQGAGDSQENMPGFNAGSLLAPRLTLATAPQVTSFASLVNTATTTDTLPAETGNQIVQALRMQFGRDGGEAHIKLDPRQFGDVSVRIRVDNGQVVARVEADAPVVREWLQSNQHVLRQNLAGQQLTLDRLDVAEPRSSSDQEAESETSRRDEQPEPRRQRRRPSSGELFDVVA